MDNAIAVTSKSDYAIFTVCNLAYLPKALVLGESVLQFNNVKLKIFLFDKKIGNELTDLDVDIYWIEDLKIPNFLQLAFKYDIIELSTSLKPYLSIKLLDQFEKVIFLDPDICLFNSVSPILNDLDHHSIVLTPHYTTPQSNDASESDIGMLRFGSFNLGFYAVKKSSQALYFLNWWSTRCLDFCYMESQFGLSTDQKWVTIAPCFFQDVHISFNLGYNFAPWNSWERKVTKDIEGNYIVNDTFPLIFFHFSNFNEADLEYLTKRSHYEKDVHRPDILELSSVYLQKLKTKRLPAASVKYAYDYMSQGEYISPTLRRAYASILSELPVHIDPFDSTGTIGKFARRNFLFEKSGVPYSTMGFKDISNKKNKNQLRLIFMIMRLVLRIIGPNKFHNVSRLLVYLSSSRQTRDLWKY